MAIVDIAEDAARSLVESIGAEHGAGRALAIRADICQPDECARFVARLWDRNLADADAAKAAGSPAAWQMLGSQSLWPGAKPVQ